MGACVSAHHKASASPMKAQISFDSTKKSDHKVVMIHHPSSNEKFAVMNGHVAVKPQLPPSQSPSTFSNFGSKEETFFDSQAWLDSDYEDDFMSVNGEFTPSRGNTPVHHNLTLGTKPGQADTGFLNQNEVVHSTREPSPTPSDKKTRLLDLFKESVREEDHICSEETMESPKKDSLKSKSQRHLVLSCFSNMLYVRGSGKQKKKNLTSSVSLSRAPVVG